MRRILTWDPPLMVTVLVLFGVVIAVSLFMTGEISPFALLLAGVGSGAQAHRKRRLSTSRTS